ncbi:MAG: hypothetical protein WCP72_10525, partial [Desulfomonile sp.]
MISPQPIAGNPNDQPVLRQGSMNANIQGNSPAKMLGKTRNNKNARTNIEVLNKRLFNSRSLGHDYNPQRHLPVLILR